MHEQSARSPACWAGSIGDALVVDSYDQARALARSVSVPVATMAGEVFRGGWRVEGGSHQESRGILETRAEIQSLRDRVAAMTGAVQTLTSEATAVHEAVLRSQAFVEALMREQHDLEKAIVGFEAQSTRLMDEGGRVGRRLDVVGTERGRAIEAHTSTERRREEAIAAIGAHELQMREAEENLGGVMARLQRPATRLRRACAS